VSADKWAVTVPTCAAGFGPTTTTQDLNRDLLDAVGAFAETVDSDRKLPIRSVW
jgi:hypothetical protein